MNAPNSAKTNMAQGILLTTLLSAKETKEVEVKSYSLPSVPEINIPNEDKDMTINATAESIK